MTLLCLLYSGSKQCRSTLFPAYYFQAAKSARYTHSRLHSFLPIYTLKGQQRVWKYTLSCSYWIKGAVNSVGVHSFLPILGAAKSAGVRFPAHINSNQSFRGSKLQGYNLSGPLTPTQATKCASHYETMPTCNIILCCRSWKFLTI